MNTETYNIAVIDTNYARANKNARELQQKLGTNYEVEAVKDIASLENYNGVLLSYTPSVHGDILMNAAYNINSNIVPMTRNERTQPNIGGALTVDNLLLTPNIQMNDVVSALENMVEVEKVA